MIAVLNKINKNYTVEEKDVLDIISAYLKQNNLESYLRDVQFDDNSKSMGAYDIKNHVIILNDEKIIKFCYKTSDRLQKIYQIDDEYYHYFLNFFYLYILFHELEHVKQVQKFRDQGTLLCQFLYELCLRLHRNDQAFYTKNHDLFPTEIDANNNGYLKAYNLLSHTNLPSRELEIMRAQYNFSLLYNYEKINCQYIKSPINKLCDINQNIDTSLLYKLLETCKPNRLERLNLGLSITPLEFDRIEKEKCKIILLKK